MKTVRMAMGSLDKHPFESEGRPDSDPSPGVPDDQPATDPDGAVSAPGADQPEEIQGTGDGEQTEPTQGQSPTPSAGQEWPPPLRTRRLGNRPGPSIWRLSVGIVLAAVVAIAALWMLSRFVGGSDQTDILALIPEGRQDLTSFYETGNGEDLAELVFAHAAWRVSVPQVEGSAPRGLGFAEIRPGISTPVLVFGGEGDALLLISVVNYAFLDTHEDLLRLDRNLLEALSEERTFVLPPSSNRLLWRTGDDIFIVASNTGSREALADRILP